MGKYLSGFLKYSVEAKKWFVSEKKEKAAKNTLHERGTIATRNKLRMSKEISEFL